MANIRTIGNVAGRVNQINDTDIGLLGGIDTNSGNLTIKAGHNSAFTIDGPTGNISYDSIVITNIEFDNNPHTISVSTQTATNNGAGMIILSGSGGVVSGVTAGGIGGTTLILSGTGGAAVNGDAGTGGNGGDVNLTAASGGTGSTTGAGGNGGNVNFFAGNAGTDNGGGGGNGGYLVVDAGAATGAGVNGVVNIASAIASAMTIANGTIPVTANGVWTFTQGVIGSITTSQNVQSNTTFTCPTGVAVNDAVYLTGSLAVDQAEANDYVHSPVIGFVLSKPTTTSAKLQYYGELGGFSGLTPGLNYFLSDTTPGGITSTAPVTTGTVVQLVGVALSTTILLVKIDNLVVQNT